jgi:hypothetical protein
MAFTYNQNPGTGNASDKRDAVRLLIGDTDTNDQQLQDAEVDFFITEVGGSNLKLAASRAARSIAALYARLIDTSVEGVSTHFSQRQKHYTELAHRLDQASRRQTALGSPSFGGVSIDTVEDVNDDDDRIQPAFQRRQFRNPPTHDEDEEIYQR